MTMQRRALSVFLGAVLSVLLFAPAAGATPAPAPRDGLLTALKDVVGLASQASPSAARTSFARAARELAQATKASLWVDASDSDAPAYGTRVFTNSLRAVTQLRRVSASASAASAIGLIVGADRALAERVIAEARAGNHRVLEAARRAVSSGDRQAAANRPGNAVRLYTKAWTEAFASLTQFVARQISHVPFSDLADAAENALGSKRIGLSRPKLPQGQPPLMLAGKPEVFYAGSEACPFCGVQRWGMILALSQFGTFSNLHLMQSSPLETPEVRTFTFFGSSYQSRYISFVPVEVISNILRRNGFAPRQRLTPSQEALINQFDPPQTVPFIDVANRFITVHSTVFPRLIKNLSWTQLTRSLRRPSSISAQAVSGEAEVLTAEVCEATNGQPASVCSTNVVRHYEDALSRLNGKGGGCPTAPSGTADVAPEPGQPPVAAGARCHH